MLTFDLRLFAAITKSQLHAKLCVLLVFDPILTVSSTNPEAH